MNLNVFQGGQFRPACGGQFKSARGGQFDRRLHYSLYIFDDEATAINQIDGQIVYANAFPNPTDNEITIKTNLDQADLFTIEVSNISGQILIKEENVQMTAGNNQTNLNIHNLPTGLYTITLISNHLKTSFKIVKQ